MAMRRKERRIQGRRFGGLFRNRLLLPIAPQFEFLRPGSYKNSDLLGEGFRLKTQKFRGQISQGLVLPLSILPPGDWRIGQCVAQELGVRKWEISERATSGGHYHRGLPAGGSEDRGDACAIGARAY